MSAITIYPKPKDQLLVHGGKEVQIRACKTICKPENPRTQMQFPAARPAIVGVEAEMTLIYRTDLAKYSANKEDETY